MSEMVNLPRRVYRHQVIYRAPVQGAVLGVRSCGFMLKPTRGGAYVDRTIREYVLVYVLRGGGTFTDWHGRGHRVSAGDAIQMPPGRRHSVVQDPDGRWAEVYVTIDGAFAAALEQAGTIDVSRALLRPGLDLGLVERFEAILEDLSHAPDSALPGALVRAHELLVTMHALDRQARGDDGHAAMVEAACMALARDLHERLDVPTIAERFGVSYERFRKIFRQRVGVSPAAYRIRHRIERAKALIAQERMSNKQVAYALGYRDPFTFSKQFKHVMGVSPEGFRRTV